MRLSRSFVRFCLVGVVNTLAGYGSIVLAKAGLGLPDVAANLAGNSVGLVVSFVLNRRFTFAARGPVLPAVGRFLVTFGVAYSINLVALLTLLHHTSIDRYLAHLVATVPYTAVFYLLSRHFVFAAGHHEAAEGSTFLAGGAAGRGRAVAGAGLGLATLVATWLLLNGYSFGLDDHAIHLPFLLRTLDPGFLPHDPLVATVDTHPSLFWRMQAAGLAVLDIHALYLLIHVVSLALMFAGTWALGRAMFEGPLGTWAGALGCLAHLVPKDTCTWIMSFDDVVLNRTVSMGPLLLALALAVRGRVGWAYVLTGLTFNVHPTTASHGAILVFVVGLGLHGWRRALAGTPGFFVAALPLVMLILGSDGHRGVPFPPSDDWVRWVRLQVWFHHFPSTWSLDNYLHVAKPLALLLAAHRVVRSRAALALVIGVALSFAAGTMAIEVVRLPTALHLHILEITRFLDYVAAVVGGAWVASTLPARARPTLPMLALAAFALDWEWATVGLCVLALAWPAPRGEPRAFAWRWVPGLVGMVIAGSLATRGVRPVRPTLEEHTGYAAMRWAAEHLPPDAVVATPPYMTHPVTSFRFVARRTIVGTFKDGAEGSFDERYLQDWVERMDALCECRAVSDSPARGPDDWFAVQKELLDGYRGLDADGFRRLATRYGATHALVERSPTRSWRRPWDEPAPADVVVVQPELPVLYEDDEYVIHAILSTAPTR